MKTVTCFISSLYVGGAEHQLSILAGLLAKKGYNVEFVTYADLPDTYTLDPLVKRIKVKTSKRGWLKQLQVFCFLLSHKTDVLISFRERMNFLALVPMIFRPKVKTIAGERNLTVGEPTKYGKINLKYLYKRADFIVPNSYAQKEFIANRCPNYASSGKLVTITNYTEIDKYKETSCPAGERLEIGIFCRYARQKNYERFADVVENLKKDGIKFHVNWYGMINTQSGISSDYLKFKEIVEIKKIGDVITLNDQVKDVFGLMPRFDIICLPSIFEGFSNSLSEAISCGKPVVAGDVSDNKIMVQDGKNGFLFDPYNVDDMTSALRKMLTMDYEKRKAMGHESRKLAEKLFNSERFVNEYIKLIES